ncbi:MAG: response regulator [Deltaproteobacteria bacterium]|nr:MAG: response regulator [Deltaproteobacteria bacterium]
MANRSLLDWKRVLIVDDEPDVLEILEELLPMCDVVKATSYDEGKVLLETQYFDMVILDIMGVDGYKLLEIAKEREVIPIMLTAHALSPDNVIRSYKEGAASYVPKEKMDKIVTFLSDILEAREKGKSFWWRWLDRFASYFDRKFGPDWREKDKEFWEKFPYWMFGE